MNDINEELTKELMLCARFLRHRPMSRQQIMRIIDQQGPIPQKDLLMQSGVTPPSMSEMIGKMEASGLIERKRNDNDGRAFDITLSDKGKQQLHDLETENLYEVLSNDEKTMLKETLYKLNNDWMRREPLEGPEHRHRHEGFKQRPPFRPRGPIIEPDRFHHPFAQRSGMPDDKVKPHFLNRQEEPYDEEMDDFDRKDKHII